MAIRLKVETAVDLVVDKWILPKDSLLYAIAALRGHLPDSERGVTLLRVELPADGDPVRTVWDDWYRHSMSEYWTASVADDADPTTELWLDISPAKDPNEPLRWVFIRQATVAGFTSRLSIGKTVTATAITETSGEIADRVAEARKKNAPVDPDEGAFADLHKQLHRLVGQYKSGIPVRPGEVYSWFVSNGATKGQAAMICDAWESYLSHAKNPLHGQFDPVLAEIAAVRRADSGVQSRPRTPLAWALTVLNRLDRVAVQFRRCVRFHQQQLNGEYQRPDYEITARQLLGELQAFATAARQAATHETVFGSLVENRIRQLVARSVAPLSVSSGALAGVPYRQQLDVMVWDHQLMPAVVEHGDVAVVSPTSVSAVLEIKASANLGEFALRVEHLRDDLARCRIGSHVEDVAVPVLGLVVFDDQSYDDVRAHSQNALTVLFRKKGIFEYEPNLAGILDLMRFLYEHALPAARAMNNNVRMREQQPSWVVA